MTKLVHVCQKDQRFNSYTELEITCGKAGTFYNIAQVAYLSPNSNELASKFGFVDSEHVLFIAFGKGDTIAYSEFGYAICMYTMREIRQNFQEIQKLCYKGFGSLLSLINRRGSSRCRIDVRI